MFLRATLRSLCASAFQLDFSQSLFRRRLRKKKRRPAWSGAALERCLWSFSELRLKARALLGRDSRDRLQDAAGNRVRIALRVRTTVFQIAAVAVGDEGLRQADGSAAIAHAVVEFVDGLRLMQAGQAQVIVRPIDGDVLVLVFVERGHEGVEIILAA